MKTIKSCLSVWFAVAAFASVSAVEPTAVWEGADLADGTQKGGMTLYLNGNASAGGVVTIGSVPVYIETGLASSSANEGTEVTLVLTWENVASTYAGYVTFSTSASQDTVGIEAYNYGLYGILDGSWWNANWSCFTAYPSDLASHKLGFAYAGPTGGGLGTGGYKGCACLIDGGTANYKDTMVHSGLVVNRINIGGYQAGTTIEGAKITRIAVYTSALTETELKAVTGEEEEPEEPDPEPEEPTYDEEVVASFYGFENLVSSNYTANLNGNTVTDGKVTIGSGAIRLTSDETWTGTDVGISVLVKYSDFVQPGGDAALVTLKNTQAGSMDSGVGVSSVATTAKIQGVWQNKVWTNQACDNSIAESGYIVMAYQGGVGTTLYDGSGNILYQAPKLVSSKSQTIGDVLTIGGLGDNTLLATNMVVEGVRIFKGALSADEITAAVADFEADEAEYNTLTYDWTKWCEDVTYTSTPLAKDVTAGTQLKVAFKGMFSAADMVSARIAYFSGDTNDIYLDTDENGLFVLTLKRKTSEDEYSATSTTAIAAGAHKFGMLVRRGTSAGGHVVSIIVTMDGNQLVSLGDGSLTFNTNPMRKLYLGDSTKTGNAYTSYYVGPESALDSDAKTVAALIKDVRLLFPGADPEPEVEVCGAACLYDWTFTNTVENTGSRTIKAAYGSQNTTPLTGDGSAHYTNEVDDVYTALKAYVRPYAKVTISGGQSVAYYGTASAATNTILFTIGNGTGNFFVATGAEDGEIVLGRMASLSAEIADSTLITATGVKTPSVTPHLYTIYISSDSKTVKLSIDGAVVDTKTYDAAQTINTGLQISGVYGGKPTNWLREETPAATSAVSCLRVFDHELTVAESDKLMAEFESQWPKPVEPVVVPEKDFTYEPKAGAVPTGWITGWTGEAFTKAGQFRLGPDGECVSVVSSSQHPYAGLAAKSGYTMALYADISQVERDKTGRFMLDLGNKNVGINQGLLMTQSGNVMMYQANKTTVQYNSVVTTNAPTAGYHLFVWTQSTTDGATLYIDGVKIGTEPSMTSATSGGFQIGNMYGGVWNSNYSQGVGMAVAGVYGWGQVLSDEQVALLAERYPPVTGITATTVDSTISGTLNLVNGDSIAAGTYSCAIAVADGATVNLIYDGAVEQGAQILTAKSISVTEATFTINGEPLPKGLVIDATDGKMVVGKMKVTTYLNPYAVKDGDAIKVSCNADADKAQAAHAFDNDSSTYFEPGDAANAKGVSWTGIEFTNGVIVTRIAYSGNKVKRLIGGAFQGANEADFSDAVNMHVVEEYAGGTADVTLEEAKGPFKYLRFMGMYGGNVKEIRFYGLADSGTVAPTNVPNVVDSWSDDGVAKLTIRGDDAIPQVFVVQRAMRNFCDADGSDYETCVSLAPQLGEEMIWNDSKATGYAMYRVKGFNANGESDWKYFEIEPEKLINGAERPSFGGNLPGFYTNEPMVTITYPVDGAKIYYTTDGSTPTTNSMLYTEAIRLVDVCGETNALTHIRPNPVNVTDSGYVWKEPTKDQPNVNVIRARAFLPDGSASTNDVAGTWLVGATVNEHKLRVISIQTDADNFFGDAKGILVPGDIFKTKGWPGGTVGSPNANYFQSGDDWERPAQLEIFDTDRTRMLASPIGTRVRGNWSRAAAKKSLTCYFRKEYGAKNAKLKLFNDEGKMKFKRFIVRNGGNDWYKFGYRDAIGQSLFRGYVTTGTQGFEPGLLYINGEYWGLYNLRHCYSKHHFEEWNGSVGDDIDYVKMSPDDGNHFEVQEGDLNEMWNIMQYLVTHTTDDGVLDDEEYAHVESQIDIADMIDYYIVNVFLGNNDWNGNNMGYWRNRSGTDTKWHFTVYDCDSAMSFGGDSYGTDHIQVARNANDTDESATRMVPGFLKRCFYNEDFKKRFANRYADLLNTALKAERTTNIVAEVAANVRHELPRNIDRWTNIGSEANWDSQLATVTKFFYKRPDKVFAHIINHCNGGSLAEIGVTANGLGNVAVNTIESGKEFELPFTGQYFTDIPITLTASPEKGYDFAGWKIGEEIVSTEESITLTPTNGVAFMACFEPTAGENPQQALRLVEIYGSTNVEIDPDGDTGEFVIITNTSDQAVNLNGLALESFNRKKEEVSLSCAIGEDVMIAARGSYKMEMDVYWPTEKISNGKIKMTITDSDGAVIQTATTQFAGDADGKGASLIAQNLNNPCDEWAAGPIHDVPPEPEPSQQTLFAGDYPDGATVTLTNDTTVIVSNATFGAALCFTGDFAATILVPEGTASAMPTLTAAGAIVLEGAGALAISNDTTLISCGGLTVEGGVLDLQLDNDKGDTMVAAEMSGSYIQNGGEVRLRMNCPGSKKKSAYGFRWKKQPDCVVELNGGTFAATMHSDVNAAAFKANEPSNSILFGKAKITGIFTGTDGRMVDTDGELSIKSGAKVTVDSTAAESRIFKAAKSIKLRKAQITVNALGEGSEIFSTDDTIDAGHEEMVLILKSTDDCFSAHTNIIVSAGVVYGQSVGNDVFDSNGAMTLSGGTILAYALTEGHAGIDTECDPDNGLDHTLTIKGGTVVALGGAGSAWPTNSVFKQAVFTNTACSAAAWSGKYLVVQGATELADVTTTAGLPSIADDFAMLVSTAGLTDEPTACETHAGTQIAEGVPAWVKTVAKTFQEHLRFVNIYGSTDTSIDPEGDTDEWFILTNTCDKTANLNGLDIEITKTGTATKKSKCHFAVTNMISVKPNASYKFEQDDWTSAGWEKITNGDIRYVLSNGAGTIQEGNLEFCAAADGGGASMVTTNLAVALTYGDWEPSFKLPSTNTTGNAGIDLDTTDPEKAEARAKGYDVVLTEDDKAAGVEKDMLKMEAVAVTNETGAVTGYKAVVAVNPEVVPAPTVGEDPQSEVEPIVITPDGEGKTEVSVGIVNATKGLWYGYEVCNALGEDFANDVPSFERATGNAITITGSKRDGSAAFFRVKVLPAKPTK